MSKGKLRIYLGSAPGVGKTFAMLDEGRRRLERNADVVIGVVETHGRAKTIEQVRGIPVVASRVSVYRGSTFTELDLDAILARAPELCLVDELAHTNAPGSQNKKRWQDVQCLLDAGIDVISTVNVQHLESLNDVVERITGVVQRETVPDSVVRAADQIELVDMSPEALRRRMAHGNIYPAERIDTALANYFRPGNLGALRELALLWVADRVEESLQSYLDQHGIDEVWETRERIMVAVSSAVSSDNLIRRGGRIARRTKGDLVAVHVASSDGRSAGRSSDSTSADLETRRRLVTELGGTYREIVADDVAAALASIARAEHATQLVIGMSSGRSALDRIRGSLVQRVIGKASGIDIHVVSTAEEDAPRVAHTVRRRSPVGRQRVLSALAMLLLGLPAVTGILVLLRDQISLSTVLLTFLTFVVAIATVGGRRISLVAAVAAAIIENWFFVAPLHTLSVGSGSDAVSLVMFLIVATTVGTLVERTSWRAADAAVSRSEAEALARSTATLAGSSDPVPGLLDQLRSTFGLSGVAVLQRKDDEGAEGWVPVAVSGAAPPTSSSDGTSFPLRTSELTPDHLLVVSGRTLSGDDHRFLAVLIEQLSIALESARLSTEADATHSLAEVDATRTALLRAVSHDLRSPLAAIKTYVSGLRSSDVVWTAAQVQETLAAVDEETDRLNRLVGNLLDASRLETGMTIVDRRPTVVAEVVEAALQSASAMNVLVSLPAELPLIEADPHLLERAIANIITNAVRHGASSTPVCIEAAEIGSFVHIRVIDRGPGIAEKDRATIVAPFHRLGDRNPTDGVGLGLAITTGFISAMNGKVMFDDTPGGGLSVTLALPKSQLGE